MIRVDSIQRIFTYFVEITATESGKSLRRVLSKCTTFCNKVQYACIAYDLLSAYLSESMRALLDM